MQDRKQAPDLPCWCPGASPSVVPCHGTVVPGVKMYSFCTVWLLDVSAAAQGMVPTLAHFKRIILMSNPALADIRT